MSDTAAGTDLVSDDELLGLSDENADENPNENRGEPQLVTVPSTTKADRLDKVLAGLLPDHSRSRLQGWIEAGNVHVNGAPGKVRQTVGPGDELQVPLNSSWWTKAPSGSW
ncbi:hypothetical protein G6F54_013928 [Rhizopus delemar]|nr:hypothetical protein G6F54_013928 [Rhizopus delemar]